MTIPVDVAIIGAGPYGLSLAAYLQARGIDFRIFGHLMEGWQNHMPEGMDLKSVGRVSSIADPENSFTLKRFSAEQGLAYDDTEIPVPLENFIAYGRAFQARFVPQVERRKLIALDATSAEYKLTFDDGEKVTARHVVIAVGFPPFKNIPPVLAHLPREFLSHSCDYGRLDGLKGREVIVLGRGSSALDLAVLLHERGVAVTLLARSEVSFYKPPAPDRNWLQRVHCPDSGLGAGWRHRFCTDYPQVFRHFPLSWRLHWNSTLLDPIGGYFIRDRFLGHVPAKVGRIIERADAVNGRVRLFTRARDGSCETLEADHVVAATGYKGDLSRLGFLSDEVRRRIRTIEGQPALSTNFESSVPGLYFTGWIAVNSFGLVMRHVCGTIHVAPQLARHFSKALVRRTVSLPAVATSS